MNELISKIECPRLRRLAEVRREEFPCFSNSQNEDLVVEAIRWCNTPEGHDFWANVYYGDISDYKDALNWMYKEDSGDRYDILFNVFKGNAIEVKTTDKTVQNVIKNIDRRSLVGLKDYGISLRDNDLPLQEWIKHIQEELLDAANYLEKLKEKINEIE